MSKIETGRIDDVSTGTVARLAAALGARADLRIVWNGEGLDRLLDGEHASLVESLADRLRRSGWEAAVEVTFNVRGERGSVDVMALHRATATVLIAEVKTVVPDAGGMLATLDRKARLGEPIARTLEGPCRSVARLLVVADSTTSRRRIAALGATFIAAFPTRGRSVARWLRAPDGAMSGLLFLPYATRSGRSQRTVGRQRVRVRGGRPQQAASRRGPR